MVAGYSADAGLAVLAEFETRKPVLLDALARAEAAPELIDPFPSFRHKRISECVECCNDPQFCDCEALLLQTSREEFARVNAEGRYAPQAV